jgi:hypothetical protein
LRTAPTKTGATRAADRGSQAMSTTKYQGAPVGDNQRRAIRAALRLLDRMLCEVEPYAQGREVHSVFYVERNGLSPDARTNLLGEIAQMRDRLRELKDDLGLEAEPEDVGRRIWGECSTLWEVLVETKSRFLQRYGPPPAGLAPYLDPRIDILIEHLRHLTDLVRPAGK